MGAATNLRQDFNSEFSRTASAIVQIRLMREFQLVLAVSQARRDWCQDMYDQEG